MNKPNTKETNNKPPTPAKPVKAKRAVYCGRRINIKGRLSYFWLQEGEAQMLGHKNQLAPAKIGECWEFHYACDDRMYPIGSYFPPRRIADELDSRSTQWAAEEQVHLRLHAEARINKQLAKREIEFDEALRPLRRMLDTLQTNENKAAFIAQVQSALWRRMQ